MKSFILENSSLYEKDLEEYLNRKDKIIEIPLDSSINDFTNNKDMLITEKTLRYNGNNLLSHVIGYVNKSENRGESGIERLYDEILNKSIIGNSLFIELMKRKAYFLIEVIL